jgi:hypothetical protein
MSISTMVINGDSEMGALLRRQQELVTQLRALILPALHQADGRSAELAINLLDEVTDCIAGIMSRLQLSGLPVGASKDGGPAVACNLDDRTINNVGQKRRFLATELLIKIICWSPLLLCLIVASIKNVSSAYL